MLLFYCFWSPFPQMHLPDTHVPSYQTCSPPIPQPPALRDPWCRSVFLSSGSTPMGAGCIPTLFFPKYTVVDTTVFSCVLPVLTVWILPRSACWILETICERWFLFCRYYWNAKGLQACLNPHSYEREHHNLSTPSLCIVLPAPCLSKLFPKRLNIYLAQKEIFTPIQSLIQSGSSNRSRYSKLFQALAETGSWKSDVTSLWAVKGLRSIACHSHPLFIITNLQTHRRSQWKTVILRDGIVLKKTQ